MSYRMATKNVKDGEDPGFIITFSSADTVHECMDTRLISDLMPSLSRGNRISMCMKVNLFFIRIFARYRCRGVAKSFPEMVR